MILNLWPTLNKALIKKELLLPKLCFIINIIIIIEHHYQISFFNLDINKSYKFHLE